MITQLLKSCLEILKKALKLMIMKVLTGIPEIKILIIISIQTFFQPVKFL